MPQKKYYYDELTCTYQEEKPSLKNKVKYLSLIVGAGLVFGGVFFMGFYSYWDDIKSKNLKDQNALLLSQIEEISEKLVGMEGSLNTLHERDNDFYRSLLNSKPIDKGIWEGGKGGAVSTQILDQPEALRNAAEKLDNLSYKVELQSRSYEHLKKLLADNQERLKRIPAIKPVPGVVISGFGVRVHPILKIRKEHTGLDFTAPIGTPVVATADGEVVTAGSSSGGYGNQVEINHGHGYMTKYAHLSEVKVSVGQKVNRGDIIALTGNTGLSSGPHLHYEILRDDTKIDPVDYFYQDLSPKEYEQFRQEAQAASQTMD